MSKHETWRTRKYWERIGGLLIEEFIAVKRTSTNSIRLIDGLIILDEQKAIHSDRSFDIEGKNVIVVQTKANRIGMYLLGQAYFSKLLIEKHNPKSIKVVAICGKTDAIMEELAQIHDIEIVVIPNES